MCHLAVAVKSRARNHDFRGRGGKNKRQTRPAPNPSWKVSILPFNDRDLTPRKDQRHGGCEAIFNLGRQNANLLMPTAKLRSGVYFFHRGPPGEDTRVPCERFHRNAADVAGKATRIGRIVHGRPAWPLLLPSRQTKPLRRRGA